MQQGLPIIDGQTHDRQLQATARKRAVGQTRRGQSLHPRLFKPGDVGPVPKHPGMVSVLGQHTPFQEPAPGFHHGVHDSGLGLGKPP